MPITIGLDAGTTTITALALDVERGEVIASSTLSNDADVTSAADAARGRSEWDAVRVLRRAAEALQGVAARLGTKAGEVAGIGLTGQQHGVVILDGHLAPVTPFIGWRDRRGLECMAGDAENYVARAARLIGGTSRRAGCAMAAGFMGVTLFWMRENGELPPKGLACFMTDWLGTGLTGATPVTDPTMGASSGLFGAGTRRWDVRAIEALGLPVTLFPDAREAGERFGALTPDAGRLTGLPSGLPVCVGLGDNQASFVGSVSERDTTVQVNIGTGGQVGRYTDVMCDAPPLEVRPFPRGGYLVVEAGLCGGRAYATLRQFLQRIASDVLHLDRATDLYAAMNTLAEKAPRGAAGLVCEPFFTGSRAQPERRASWSGISEDNFIPANMIRALLEGMARAFADGYARIRTATSGACTRLVGTGNGVRENPLLAQLIAQEFGLPLAVPEHREEAAFGAAVTAAVGVGALPDLAAGGRLIRYRDA